MELDRYMLEYALHKICDGNKTYCALLLGVHYDDFRKTYKRVREGHSSIIVTRGVLNLFWRKGIELKDVFAEYDISDMGHEIECKESACEEAYRKVLSRIERYKRNALDAFTIFKASEELCEEMKAHYCDEVCPCQRIVTNDCPLMMFEHFIIELTNIGSVFSEEKAHQNLPKTE